MEVTTGTRVQLPPGVEGGFEVYVNGVRQREGSDYVREGDLLLFGRSLAHEGRLGFWRWTSLFFGVAGTYRKNDSVDVVYEVGGRRIVRTGLPIEPAEPIDSEENRPAQG
jgi:hypothetical protein